MLVKNNMAIIRGDKPLLEKIRDVDTWICFAKGRTYQYKEELKSYGFVWVPEDNGWMRESVSNFAKLMFERFKTDGKWFGVLLTFERDPSWDWLKKALDKEKEEHGRKV